MNSAIFHRKRRGPAASRPFSGTKAPGAAAPGLRLSCGPWRGCHGGFTLIELLVTISILAVLAAVVLPLSELSVKRAREAELKAALRSMRAAIDEYKKAADSGKIKKDASSSGYPPSLAALVEAHDDLSSKEAGVKIRFLRSIPMDPVSRDSGVAAEESWGLRSYKSSADDPEEGDDVFDIYSRSDGTAIDGTAYRRW